MRIEVYGRHELSDSAYTESMTDIQVPAITTAEDKQAAMQQDVVKAIMAVGQTVATLSAEDGSKFMRAVLDMAADMHDLCVEGGWTAEEFCVRHDEVED